VSHAATSGLTIFRSRGVSRSLSLDLISRGNTVPRKLRASVDLSSSCAKNGAPRNVPN
jgi:hypothetical protein